MTVKTYAQFQTLPNLKMSDLQTGDVLLKKIFHETVNTRVEGIITGFQRAHYETWKRVKIGNEKFLFENKGSPTSEHAAMMIHDRMMAEAVGEGVIRARGKDRVDERYIVYRCRKQGLRDAAVKIAEGLSLGRIGSQRIKYSCWGAATSLFRKPTFKQASTAKFLDSVINYVYGIDKTLPNMFCSEFVVTCYEAGSVAEFGKTAMGTDPHGMSPMQFENDLNHFVDLFKLVGRVEMRADILYPALLEAVQKYEKSLGGLFRRPSPESLGALKVFKVLLQMGASDQLFSAVEHFTAFKPTVAIHRSMQLNLQAPHLKRDSTFYKFLKEHLQHTGLFNM